MRYEWRFTVKRGKPCNTVRGGNFFRFTSVQDFRRSFYREIARKKKRHFNVALMKCGSGIVIHNGDEIMVHKARGETLSFR